MVNLVVLVSFLKDLGHDQIYITNTSVHMHVERNIRLATNVGEHLASK